MTKNLNNVLDDTDYLYGLLTEGRMDMMYLPSGAVAWLWQFNRPQAQIDSASQFAAMAHDLGDPIVDGALLRADKNVMVLHLQSGNRVSVYPDGGLGSNGEPIQNSPDSFHNFITMGNAPEMGATTELPVAVDAEPPVAVDVEVSTDSDMDELF